MSLLTSLVWLLSVDGLFVYLFKKRSEMFFVFSIVVGGLFLFLGGLVNNVKLGYYLSWLLVFLFYFLIIKDNIKNNKNNIKEFLDNYFTIGLFVFVILVIYIQFLNNLTGFYFYDEFMHWGPMVKETIRLNRFYCVSESTLMVHKDYPPFFTLIEVLWCYFSRAYSESYCYRAMNIFLLSLFMPIFIKSKIKSCRDVIITIFCLLAILLIPFSVYSLDNPSDGFEVYRSIYTDWNMASFVAFLIFIVFKLKQERFKYIYLSVMLIALLLMKQICIAFYLLILLCIVIKDHILDRNKIVFSELLFIIVLPVVFMMVWKYVTDFNGAQAEALFKFADFKLNNFMSIVRDTHPEHWHHLGYVKYIDSILHRSLVVSPIKITYFPYCFIITIFMFGILSINNSKNHAASVSSVFLFGSIAYAFAMLLLYMFSFDKYEAPIIASFERYIGSYIFTGNCLLVMITVDEIFSLKKDWQKIVLAGAILIFSVSISESKYYDKLIPKNTFDGKIQDKNFLRTKYVLDNLCIGKKVLIIEQYTENGIYTNMMLPYLYANDEPCDYFVKALKLDDSSSDFLKEVREYDYIYLLYPDDNFVKIWHDITDMYILRYGLYNIIKEDDKVVFELIGSYEEY